MEGGTSCAFTVSQNKFFILDHAIRLNNENSIYQAGLFAIDKALQRFATTNNHSALILTDNRSFLDALCLVFPWNIILKNIFNKLLSLKNCSNYLSKITHRNHGERKGRHFGKERNRRKSVWRIFFASNSNCCSKVIFQKQNRHRFAVLVWTFR